MRYKVNNSTIQLIKGDITESSADAVVNAANTQVILGGGVAGAIRRKGGPKIQAECDKKGPISVGEAAITTAGALKAKFVIHAAGPRQGEGDEKRKLKNATLNSLRIADENNLRSITFPAISTGIFGFPIDLCVKIMLDTTVDYLKGATCLKEISFCLFDESAYNTFESYLQKVSQK